MVASGANAAQPRANLGVAAEPPVALGTAGTFGVLAGTTVTNTGLSVINGDLGVSPGTAITGFPPGVVNGTIHAGDAVAAQAQADLTTAYNDAAGRPGATMVATELGGTTLMPGLYDSASGTFQITGTLTLDGQGDPNAVFIFQAASTLVTASGSAVNFINGAQACNVFWQVGSSATLGTGSSFSGSILALTSITVTTNVTVDGRMLARNGAVTMDTNTITVCEEASSSIDITKVADATSIGAGTPMGFTITVTSTGPGTANDVMLSDPLPTTPGTSWSIDGGTGASMCSISSGTLMCDFGSMPNGSFLTVHITSPTTRESYGVTTNTAFVTTSNAGSDEASASVFVDCPLRLKVWADAPQVPHGSQIGFKIRVFSMVDTDTDDVSVKAMLPPGTWSIDPASSAGCSISGRILACAFDVIGAKQARVVHITATPQQPGTAILRVTSSWGDGLYRHTASAKVTIV